MRAIKNHAQLLLIENFEKDWNRHRYHAFLGHLIAALTSEITNCRKDRSTLTISGYIMKAKFKRTGGRAKPPKKSETLLEINLRRDMIIIGQKKV